MKLSDAADLLWDALQLDLEQGVAWLNEEAWAKFAKDFPTLSKAIGQISEAVPDTEEYATVWHEGSRSYYHATLLRKMSQEEVAAETEAAEKGG